LSDNYLILIDNREKQPLTFPSHLVLLDPAHPPWSNKTRTVRIHTHPARLSTADYFATPHPSPDSALPDLNEEGWSRYILGEAPRSCIIERKGSASELMGNLFKKDRYESLCGHLERMSKFDRSYLVLEGDPQSLLKPSQYCPNPHLAIDALQRVLARYNTSFILFPTYTLSRRLAFGEWVARTLINAAPSSYSQLPLPAAH
jgi:hypothetical protein